MRIQNKSSFRTLVAFAPFVFAAHFAEEIPGLVEWFNSHVAGGMTYESFWQINIGVLIITAIMSVTVWHSQSSSSRIAALVWLSFIMGANSLVHIAAALAQRQYVPGLVTASILYLPYFSFVLVRARQSGVSSSGLLAAVGAGASPMLLQGYLVICRGTRLF